MSRPYDTLTVKGRRDSLLIMADPDAPLEQVFADLLARLNGTPDFFRGARAILDVGTRPLTGEDLDQLLTVLTRYDVTVSALLTADAATRDLVQERGFATTLRVAGPAPRVRVVPDEDQGSQCLVIKHTLRSGQVVKYPGHVIVVGDVNPGAEVLAGGDVFVWGRLRGVVHAGATGDPAAIICALELAPMQLRIADLVARTPEDHHPAQPEIAWVESGGIVVETWGGK
jgi:septum site-determining protein MinC